MYIVGLVRDLAKTYNVWVDINGVEYILKWDTWLECFTFGVDSVDDNYTYIVCYELDAVVIHTLYTEYVTLVVDGKAYNSVRFNIHSIS